MLNLPIVGIFSPEKNKVNDSFSAAKSVFFCRFHGQMNASFVIPTRRLVFTSSRSSNRRNPFDQVKVHERSTRHVITSGLISRSNRLLFRYDCFFRLCKMINDDWTVYRNLTWQHNLSLCCFLLLLGKIGFDIVAVVVVTCILLQLLLCDVIGQNL